MELKKLFACLLVEMNVLLLMSTQFLLKKITFLMPTNKEKRQYFIVFEFDALKPDS